MIEISDVFSGYNKENVLNGASLICKKGEITSLIGPNGSGKSTLLKTIIGMLSVRDGDIRLDGVSVSKLSDSARAQKIAYLSQGKNIPDITVERMVLHGRFPYLSYPRKYRKCDYEATQKAMKTMEISHLARKPLSTLSGGMRQKVYIAMALCQGADIIMLDEPTTYLDISHQMKMFEICRKLANDKKTILMISHDIISALKNSDNIAIMSEGKIIKTGTAQEILNSNIIPQIFGVEVLTFNTDGIREFYYKEGEK